ncbi:MAG: mannose-1-phosphate guanylyltransferase [Candidatus Neomarinimicrobiota bacterium]|nr:MAG: mannose-1-phosphate guanylyltransferase [Candidatus Neomarinimicrobiota bacterium]
MYAVIMAGGSGTRFWPYSRTSKPKQLLSIVGETNMLQMTVDRLRKIETIQDIYVVTRQDLVAAILEEVHGIPEGNIIVEPAGKNTAPCIGLSALQLKLRDPEAVMGVFPADHLIIGHRKFSAAVETAEKIAVSNHSIVTIGIKPTFPSTAYGYIQYDTETRLEYDGVYLLKTFAEKPHQALAERFLASGDFLWNAGMFIWKVDTLLANLKEHMPELYEHLVAIDQRLAAGETFGDIWDGIRPESIDYGLMEKVGKSSYVIAADFEWNDLGSWNAVYDVSAKQEHGNVIKGNGMVLHGQNNFVQSRSRFTAVVGVDNLVVVDTEDATLVVSKDQVEAVKEVVEWLRKNGRVELL